MAAAAVVVWLFAAFGRAGRTGSLGLPEEAVRRQASELARRASELAVAPLPKLKANRAASKAGLQRELQRLRAEHPGAGDYTRILAVMRGSRPAFEVVVSDADRAPFRFESEVDARLANLPERAELWRGRWAPAPNRSAWAVAWPIPGGAGRGPGAPDWYAVVVLK